MTHGGRPPSSRGALVLATVAVLAALYAAREVLAPVALALLLVALLHPVVRALRAVRVPTPAAAAIAVVGSLALVAAVGAALAPPLRALASDVPKQVEATRAQLARIRGPFGAPFAHLVSITSGGTAKAPNAPNEPGGASSGLAGFAGRAFGTTSSVLAALVEVVLLAAFVLAADDVWPRRLDTAVASAERRREVVAAVARTRSAVARYVLATALINVGQGVLVALVAWLVHMPTPPLWGVLTFVAEFVPYLGGAVMIVLLLIVGLATVGGARALAMPAAYLVITTLQNNLVSPIVYGRGLRLSPAAILLAVMVWWALWGVAGAFLAVPILAALRIVADYVETLRPIGPFLDA